MKRLIYLILILILFGAAHARMGSLSTNITTAGTPALVQHFSSSTNPVGLGIVGDIFKIPVPTVRAGNCLILAISYPNANTPTITDNNGNTWSGSPTVTKAGSSYTASIFVLPNANAGATIVTVTFGTTIIPFNYEISEFTNIAISSPANGSSSATGTGSALSAGAFTPTTNNNTNGGNLIWSYHALADAAGGNPTSFVPGGSFTLLAGDIAWSNNQGFPHATQYFLQTSQASVTPSITATADTTDSYNSVAVALKASTGGTAPPAGIRVAKILHSTMGVPPSSWKLQAPTTGNLIVLTTANPSSLVNISAVSDTSSGTWTKVSSAADESQVWYSINRTPANNLILTLTCSPSLPMSVRIFDIVSAAVSPFDVSAGKGSTGLNGATVFNNAPSITPTSANGIVIATGGLGQGPGLAVTSPSGAQFDLVTYPPSETDSDLMENADLLAHYYNATTSTINFNWTITNQGSNSGSATAVAFH